MRALLIAALVLSQATAQTPPKLPNTPPIQSERFARDLNEKNIGDILTVHTPQAVLVESTGKKVKGEEELRKHFDELTSAYDNELRLSMTSFDQTRTFGIEHGTYVKKVRNRSTGTVQQIQGTYVFLHERQLNGEWLIAHQKWTEEPTH